MVENTRLSRYAIQASRALTNAEKTHALSAWERTAAKLCFAAQNAGREAELPDVRSQAELGNENGSASLSKGFVSLAISPPSKEPAIAKYLGGLALGRLSLSMREIESCSTRWM